MNEYTFRKLYQLKSLDFLVIHDLNSNNRLNVHPDVSNRITKLGDDTQKLLLDFMEYETDLGVDEIVLDKDEKLNVLIFPYRVFYSFYTIALQRMKRKIS